MLDMYRSAPKEQRDKVQLMAAEKKAKSEVYNQMYMHTFNLQIVGSKQINSLSEYFSGKMFICMFLQAEELRQRLRELEERERREGKKMADEEALRKIRSVEEQIDILNKKLSLAKQVKLSMRLTLSNE